MNVASLFLICVFSIDRCIAIYFPLQRTHILTKTKFSILCTMSWLVPILTSFYPLFKSGHFYYFPLLGYYLADVQYDSTVEQQVLHISSNVMVLGPFFVTIGICIAIAIKLQGRQNRGKMGEALGKRSMWWASKTQTTGASRNTMLSSKDSSRIMCQGRSVPNQPQSQQPGTSMSPTVLSMKDHGQDTDRKCRKAPKTRSDSTSIVVLKIVGLYILCLLPGNLMTIYNMLDTLKVLPDPISSDRIFEHDGLLKMYLYMSLIFSTLLYTINSCVNPYVYYFRSQTHCRNICNKCVLTFRNIFGRSYIVQ